VNPIARIPYELAGHIASVAARLTPAGGGKLRRSFAGRRGTEARFAAWAARFRLPDGPLVWMHAPSVGEGLMARPVLEHLRSAHPETQFAYTYFSPSAEALASALPVDVAGYLPFDTSAAARAMLNALRPAALVFAKLDVWPLLAAEAAARGVPTALVSATMRGRSGRASWPARALLADAYASLSAVGAAHEDDARNLVALGVRADRVVVTGDTRYDQVWARIAAPPADVELIARLRSARPTLVAGSTWGPDEELLLGAWVAARRTVPDARLIVAAHEPDEPHVARVRRWAAAVPLRCATLDDATADTDVVIVNRMGVLADLYALATLAYVGGGFHRRGLHSVVEPAAHGVPVLIGPRGVGTRDADLLLAAGGAFVVTSQSDAAHRLDVLFRDPGMRTAAGTQARGVISAGLGAAARSAAIIDRLLHRPQRS
jgi:3-deoxy-D-manno-octulosonic-acid transferase